MSAEVGGMPVDVIVADPDACPVSTLATSSAVARELGPVMFDTAEVLSSAVRDICPDPACRVEAVGRVAATCVEGVDLIAFGVVQVCDKAGTPSGMCPAEIQ